MVVRTVDEWVDEMVELKVGYWVDLTVGLSVVQWAGQKDPE